MKNADERYVPAAGRGYLTALYDPVMALTMRESAWRPAVTQEITSDLTARDILEVGSGTATLLIQLAKSAPDLQLLAVDGDPKIIERSAFKAEQAGASIDVRLGRAQELPIDDQSVDVVVMSLLLHHLSDRDKLLALSEAHRVLRGDGRLVIADWGRPHDPISRGLFLMVQMLDGFSTTKANVDGEIPGMILSSGFRDVRARDRWRTVWGSLELLVADRGA